MKKIISLLFLVIFTLSLNYTETKAAGLCRVIDSKFEPFTLHHLNKGNFWQLVDNENPVVNLSITTDNCLENKPNFKFALFSYGYDTDNKTITPVVTLLGNKSYDIKLEKDGVLKIPVKLGNKNCSGYSLKNTVDSVQGFIVDTIPILAIWDAFSDIKFDKKEDETCRYFAGFLDQTPLNERGTDGKLFRDSNSKLYSIPGIRDKDGFGNFMKKHGIEFNCTPSTCGQNETNSGDGSSGSLLINSNKSINYGYSADPCSNDKEDKCYSLLSRFPIPVTGGDVFKGEKNDGIDFNSDGTPDLFTFKTTVNTIGDNIPVEHSIILGRTGFSWLFKYLYDMIVYFMIIAAVLRLMYLGYLLITSESPKTKKELKDSFWGVFIGLGILFAVYAILNFVNPDLLNLEPKLEKVTLISSTTDNTIVGEKVADFSGTAPNSGKGYAMSGSYDNPKIAPDSKNFEEGIKQLKSGIKIKSIFVNVGSGNSTNADISFTLASGLVMTSKSRNGTSGVAEMGQGKVGDKKTPKGEFLVGGKTNKGDEALISISNDVQNAVLNSQGVNMGAAFLGLNIDPVNGYRGIGIHGRGDNSLGTTYGCIRMRNDELILIAPFVKRDAPVPIKID